MSTGAERGAGSASPLALAALAVCVALPLALARTEVHVVQTQAGVWRGLADAPSLWRCVLCLGVGGAAAWALRRANTAVRRPLYVLALAAAPFVPLLTGHGLGLVALQMPGLLPIASGLLGLSAGRAWLAHEPGPAATARARGWGREIVLALTAFLFYAWLSGHLPGSAGPQGDEPHYLLMAHSLLADGDLDLGNEFDTRAYRAFFGGTLEAHTSPASPAGVLYAVHAPGLALLIAPAYALGGHAGVQLLMAALAALTTALAQRLVREVTGRGEVAFIAWLLLTCAPPLPNYAVSIYPETPAALAMVLFLLTARRDGTWPSLGCSAAAAAALPWLHPKFLPLALLGLTLVLARRGPRLAKLAAVGMFALALGTLMALFHALYGSASLGAAYGPRLGEDVALARLPWGLPALFFDRQFGLLLLAPAWLLALPGALRLARTRLGDVTRALLLAGAVLGVGAAFSMWWGGACPPARFTVPALPALTLLAAGAIQRRRALGVALASAGLAIVILAAETPRALHNRADGESGLLRFLAPALDLDRWLPSFVLGGPSAFVLSVSLLAWALLAWRRGLRGALAGAFGYALLAGTLAPGPLLEAREGVVRLLFAWDDMRLQGVSGALRFDTLALPLDLPGAPWRLRRGDVQRSRRLALPPGVYRLEIDARPGAEHAAVHLARLEAVSDALSLDWVYLRIDRPLAPLRLPLPGGAPRFTLVATGVENESLLTGARLVPLYVVPRRLRDELRFPVVTEFDRYRVGTDALRVTVLDRSLPEDAGFRLVGSQGQFLLEGAPGTPVRVRVRRARPRVDDRLWWRERAVPLPADNDVTLTLPLSGGVGLLDAQVLPVWLDAREAWVEFQAAPTR